MNYVALALLAGLFQALNIEYDGYNLRHLGLGVYNYIFYALLTNFLFSIVLLVFKNKIDKTPIRMKNFNFKYLLFSGIAGSFYTIYYLKNLDKYGSSVIAPMAPFYIVLLVLFDRFFLKTKIDIRQGAMLFLISFGGFLVNFNLGIFNFLFIFLSLNALGALYSYFSKLSIKKKNNVIVLRIVNSGMMFFLYSLLFGKKLDLYFGISKYLPIMFSIFFVALSNIFYVIALKKGSVSKVDGLKLSNIVFVILISLFLGNFSFSLLKLSGILLIVAGIYGLIGARLGLKNYIAEKFLVLKKEKAIIKFK